MKNKKLVVIASIVVLIIAGILLFFMLRDLWPLITGMVEGGNQEIEYFKTYGYKGIPILIGIEALLAIIGFIPAAPVHILAGLAYGPWLGSFIAIFGGVLGNTAIFFIFMQFHKVFNYIFEPKKKSNFLGVETVRKMKYPELITVAAYSIPGLPNLLVPYLFSRAGIPYWRFILGVTLFGAPGVIMLVITGDGIAHGDWMVVGTIVVIMAIFGIIIATNGKRILKLIKSDR